MYLCVILPCISNLLSLIYRSELCDTDLDMVPPSMTQVLVIRNVDHSHDTAIIKKPSGEQGACHREALGSIVVDYIASS